MVPFGPIADGNVQAGEVLSLRLLTKVADSGGHSNAVGLRLCYDGVSRPSRFGSRSQPQPRASRPSASRWPRRWRGNRSTGLSAVSGGRFAARVGLIPGSNQLLARVTDAAGQSAEATLLLTFEPDPPDHDTAPEPDVHPRSGFAPLVVTFGAGQAADPTVTVVDLDTDGDGQAEFTLTDFAAPPHRLED